MSIFNDFLQTTNPKIYAAGDICSKYKFTHAADFMARIVIQNALFAVGPIGRKKVSDLIIPWATYTDPEVAHVGLYEKDLHDRDLEFATFTREFSDVDRGIVDGEGFGESYGLATGAPATGSTATGHPGPADRQIPAEDFFEVEGEGISGVELEARLAHLQPFEARAIEIQALGGHRTNHCALESPLEGAGAGILQTQA